MSKRFIQLTSGWIPVAVLLLLTAALVSGQPRAGQAAAAAPTAPVANVEDVTLVLRSIIEIPSEVAINLDAAILLPDGETDPMRFRNEPGAGQ